MKLVANARVRFSIVNYLKSLRWCKHGDEESEDFYNGSYEVNQGPHVSRVGNYVLGRNKAWRIQILADQ